MSVFDSLDVLAGGLSAQRTRMDVASSNLVNAKTTRTEQGGPYRRRDVVLEAVDQGDAFSGTLSGAMQGVQVQNVAEDPHGPRQVYDPGHPEANADGMVSMPNISTVKEYTDAFNAATLSEMMLTLMHTGVSMNEKALQLGR
jgi:flagellar basal-body rod protein FlgC